MQRLKELANSLLFPNSILCECASYDEVKSLLQLLHPSLTKSGLNRIGNKDGDGGYLIPDVLDKIDACFSPGCGGVTSFEEECVQSKIRCYVCDGSMDMKPIEGIIFKKKFLKSSSDEDTQTLEEWIRDEGLQDSKQLMLQMDVEGHEYEVILGTSESTLSQFEVIVCEFHYLDALPEKSFFLIANSAFRKLLKTHTCVHIHPNNADPVKSWKGLDFVRAMEFTFLRKDSDELRATGMRCDFPHVMDRDNVQSAESIVLPECWYSSKH